MGGKKWCEYCRINLPYDKAAITAHEETRQHLSNKQRQIKFQRMKIQKQEKEKRQLSKQTAMLGTANIPKAKKGSAQQREVQQYREGIMMEGKSAIHKLIAQKTQGKFGAPIQFPQKSQLMLPQNFREQNQQNQDEQEEQITMWRIDICEQTGKPCFINNITKLKLFQPPKGYVMTQNQKEQWQQINKICEQQEVRQGQEGIATGWVEADDEQDYFKMNECQPDSEQIDSVSKEASKKQITTQSYERRQKFEDKAQEKPIQPTIHQKVENKQESWLSQLQSQVAANQMTTSEVFQTFIYHKLKECKTDKQKNDTFKKLAANDIEIRMTTADQIQKEASIDIKEAKKDNIGFKPKKKVKVSQLIDQSDLY